MLKKFTLLVSLTFYLFGCKQNKINIQPSATELSQYNVLKLNFELQMPFEDPYDMEDIKADLIITHSNGQSLIIPCFYKNGNSSITYDMAVGKL